MAGTQHWSLLFHAKFVLWCHLFLIFKRAPLICNINQGDLCISEKHTAILYFRQFIFTMYFAPIQISLVSFSQTLAAVQMQCIFYSKINIRVKGCQRKQNVRNRERLWAFFYYIDSINICLPSCIYCFLCDKWVVNFMFYWVEAIMWLSP